MQTQAKLCHLDQDRCVVLVEGFEGDRTLGSALAEGRTVMEAEDLAIARLKERCPGTTDSNAARLKSEMPIATSGAGPKDNQSKGDQAVKNNLILRQPPAQGERDQQRVPAATTAMATPGPKQEDHVSQSKPTPIGNELIGNSASSMPPSEAPTDPEDWSEELTAIDLELQRIGWDRDKERIYLERAFGHGSRHRLTRFNDLVAYLKRLRDLPPSSDPQQTSVPLRRSDLVKQSDEILQRLKWQQEQAREFLHQNFQATSRQQLSDEQLLTFNMMLEEQLVALPDQ